MQRSIGKKILDIIDNNDLSKIEHLGVGGKIQISSIAHRGYPQIISHS